MLDPTVVSIIRTRDRKREKRRRRRRWRWSSWRWQDREGRNVTLRIVQTSGIGRWLRDRASSFTLDPRGGQSNSRSLIKDWLGQRSEQPGLLTRIIIFRQVEERGGSFFFLFLFFFFSFIVSRNFIRSSAITSRLSIDNNLMIVIPHQPVISLRGAPRDKIFSYPYSGRSGKSLDSVFPASLSPSL